MKKKMVSFILVAITTVSMFGMTAFAAGSPSTSSPSTASASTSATKSEPASTGSTYTMTSGGGVAVVGSTRVTSSYSEVTDKSLVGSVTPASTKEAATTVLSDYVAAKSAGKQTFGPFKVRMYKSGSAVKDSFGTWYITFGLGNKYDGQTVTVYEILPDGSIVETPATVSNGKVVVPATTTGTFKIALN